MGTGTDIGTQAASPMARIEPDSKSGALLVVECDENWVREVDVLRGRARRRAILPTMRGYMALRLARKRPITVAIIAADGDELRLEATLRAIRALSWDPGVEDELDRIVAPGWEKQVDERELESLCSLIWRDVVGPIRAGMSGKDLGPGPEGSRDAALV